MNLIAIGKILKPIGTKGKVKIFPLTDKVQRFNKIENVWIGDDENSAELRCVQIDKIEEDKIVACIENINSIDDAEILRNKFLFVAEENIIKLKKGSYFIHDVIGCEVVTEELRYIGVVKDLFSLPANDVWVIDSNGKEILIPAVKTIVKNVDLEIKRVTINAIEGLLD